MTASQGRALAIGVAAVVFFTNLGAAGLFDEDEPKNAACAQEMFARGDWIVPSFNHELRTDKPILVYWLMLASFHLWGVSEFSARLPSAVCAMMTVGLVSELGARLYRPQVGLAAGLVLATSLMYDVVARAATPDATLIACTTLGLYAFVRASGRDGVGASAGEVVDPFDQWRPTHLGWTIGLYAALGLAVLAKGPVGVVLPVTALVVFLAWVKSDGGVPSSQLKKSTGSVIARMRGQNSDASRFFASRAQPGSALGEVEKCQVGIFQQAVRRGSALGSGLLPARGTGGQARSGTPQDGGESAAGPLTPPAPAEGERVSEADRRGRSDVSWRARVGSIVSGGLALIARRLAPRRVLAAGLALRPLVGLVVVALVAAPWYAAISWQTDGQWLAGFLGRHNLGRFVAPLEGHGGPPFYHLLSIGIGFFPWSALFVVSLPAWRARLHRSGAERVPDVLLATWVATYLLFFSLARTKLPNYVLPAYPALALVTGAWLADAWAQPVELATRWLRLGLGIQTGVGLGLLLGFPLAARWVLPGESVLGLVGLTPLLGCGWAWWWAPGHPRRALAIVAAVAVSFSLTIFGWGAVRVAQHQTSAELVRLARDHARGEAQLASWELFDPSLVYYAGGRVERPADPAEIARFFAAQPAGYLVTRADRLDRLAHHLPPDVRELARRRRFLRTHDLVLLGRADRLARREDSATRD